MLETVLVKMTDAPSGRPIFLFPGASGDAQEVAAVAAHLEGPRPIFGVEPFARDAEGLRPATIEAMAAQAVAAIRARQAEGPYDLIGYSCGGLVALEVARLLGEAGHEVGLLGFIDVIYERRYWPSALFMKSQIKLTATHRDRKSVV